MNRKTESEKISNNQIISTITKVHPEDGDILLFQIKTDQDGFPYCDLETVQQTANMLKQMLDQLEVNASALFMFDKICLFNVENCQEAIRQLEKSISYIQETVDRVRDIENGKSESSHFVIKMDDAEDPLWGVL